MKTGLVLSRTTPEQRAAARAIGICYNTLRDRLYRGWDVVKAISEPIRERVDSDELETLIKEGLTTREVYKMVKCNPGSVRRARARIHSRGESNNFCVGREFILAQRHNNRA